MEKKENAISHTQYSNVAYCLVLEIYNLSGNDCF